jgi:hypothetical protein
MVAATRRAQMVIELHVGWLIKLHVGWLITILW